MADTRVSWRARRNRPATRRARRTRAMLGALHQIAEARPPAHPALSSSTTAPTRRPTMREYITECIGTFFLVFTVCLTVLNGTPGAPLAIGVSLMIMVYMGGHISGGHYNPAVTLAVWMRGKLSGSQVVPYWIAQLIGAIIAGLISYFIMGKSFVVSPAPSATTVQVLVTEFLFTFALCLVVLQT